MTLILKYFIVYILSGLKFVFGPVFGIANDLSIPVIIILTTLGMMTTIYLFIFWGDRIRAFLRKNRKNKRVVFSKRNRRFVKIWRTYGLKGTSFLTPLVLTPPGGGILVTLLEPRKKMILKWMWISAFLWATIVTLVIRYTFQLSNDFILG